MWGLYINGLRSHMNHVYEDELKVRYNGVLIFPHVIVDHTGEAQMPAS